MVIVYVNFQGNEEPVKLECSDILRHPFLTDMVILHEVKGVSEGTSPFFKVSSLTLKSKMIEYFLLGEIVPPVQTVPVEPEIKQQSSKVQQPIKKRKYVRSGKYSKNKNKVKENGKK